MTPTPIFIPPPLHEEHFVHLAEIHFKAEENLRLADIHFKAEQDPQSFNPDHLSAHLPRTMNREWFQLPPSLREVYMNRVQVIDAALKEADIELSSKGYTRFVTRLYYRAREIAPKARVPFSPDLYKELLRLEIADLKSSGCLSLLSSSDESSADVPMLDSQAVDSIDKRDIDEPVPLPSLQVAENPALVKLEAAVQKAIEVLEHLKQGLENTDRAIWMKDTDWVAEITKTLEHAVPAKVVIGVVGSTGAGKSSVINAVVDEENVLATNCMRASTAVATEISYNHGDSKYAAEIEFITPDEWHKELQILFSDISDCQDEVACNNVRKDSEVAVALQRVLAVYPKYDRKSILLASVAELMRDKGVTEFLGTTTTIEENDPKIFSDALALYFDSKPTKEQLRRQRRRLAGSAKGGVAAQSPTPSPASPALGRGMRLWPLIRVVRVYLKAEALSTGATLVDLPGVFDSNPGRVQVAEDYMKKCSAHWVVAPINRAVDDKVAQDLLDKNLKVQLQMDCAFNGISFICTKTDDISISEVQATLDFEPPSSKKRDKREEELKAATNELADAHFKKAEAYEQLQKIKRRIAKLEATIDRSGAPAASLPSPSKTGQAPQATADISVGEKLAHYKEQMKEINSQYITHRDQTEPLQERLDELQLEIPRIETDILREYIEARNSYAKGEIREDFAAEIREPDQEEFEDISEMQAIDYSKLEKDLPVFCVSSRAYQKLRGRLCREPGIDGFTTLADTEIFHLQKHCISLTEKAREASAREFLTNANLLLQSIGIWSSAANPSQALPDEDIHEIKARFSNEASKLKHLVYSLRDGLAPVIENTCRTNISARFDQVAKRSSTKSGNIVSRWNSTAADGGFRWNTYRAICRRNGRFSNKDLNRELATLAMNRIVSGWTRTFETDIPHHLTLFSEQIQGYLRAFHKDVIASAKRTISDEKEQQLKSTLMAYGEAVSQHMRSASDVVKYDQRSVSRMIASVILEELAATYLTSARHRGYKTLSRIQETMRQGVNNRSKPMFDRALGDVASGLVEMRDDTSRGLRKVLDTMLDGISRDYRKSMIDDQVQLMSDAQVKVKQDVGMIVKKAEAELQLQDLLAEEDTGDDANE